MPNQIRKRSNYLLALTEDQFERCLKLSKERQQSVEDLVLEAIDEFIERQKQCRK